MTSDEAERIAYGHVRPGYYSVLATWGSQSGVQVEDREVPAYDGVVAALYHGPGLDHTDRHYFSTRAAAMEFCVTQNLAIGDFG